jgi:hypothetical protein
VPVRKVLIIFYSIEALGALGQVALSRKLPMLSAKSVKNPAQSENEDIKDVFFLRLVAPETLNT